MPWTKLALGVPAVKSGGSLQSDGELATLVIKLHRVLIQIRRKMKENAKDMTNDIFTVELLSYYYAKLGQ